MQILRQLIKYYNSATLNPNKATTDNARLMLALLYVIISCLGWLAFLKIAFNA